MSAETLRVEIEDGKYTVIQEADGRLLALRYGEQWRDLTGDKLVYALAAEVEKLRGECAGFGSIIRGAYEKFALSPHHPNPEKLPEPTHVGRRFRIKGKPEIHTVRQCYVDGDDCSGTFGYVIYCYREGPGMDYNTSYSVPASRCELLP